MPLLFSMISRLVKTLLQKKAEALLFQQVLYSQNYGFSICAPSTLAFCMMYTAYKLKKAGWQHTALMYSFVNLEPVLCSMSGSNRCFLTCIQISQEAGKVVCHSHVFKTFPVCCLPHIKHFIIVNEAKVYVFFWKSFHFSIIQQILTIWSLIPLPFLNPAWTSVSFQLTYCWSLAWRILSITLLAWDECNCVAVWTFFGITLLRGWNENWSFIVLWPLLSFPNWWHNECSTFIEWSFRIWNSSIIIPSPRLALWSFLRSTWLHIPGCLALGEWSHHCGCLGIKIFLV